MNADFDLPSAKQVDTMVLLLFNFYNAFCTQEGTSQWLKAYKSSIKNLYHKSSYPN